MVSSSRTQDILALGVGTKVCVRDQFLGDWSSGFEVVEVLHDGYRIERLSDGLAFPDVFPADAVRLERRHDPDRGIAGSYLDRGP
ncbi:MAG TPA: hypothetical protein VN796_12260 [Acidimicrobiales bacterium]|nr:hypothetical protein [Acidimicrobiales bacterium]